VCGQSFALECLGLAVSEKRDGNAYAFTVGCFSQTLYAHAGCIETLKGAIVNGELDPTKLPEASPMRPALEQVLSERSQP